MFNAKFLLNARTVVTSVLLSTFVVGVYSSNESPRFSARADTAKLTVQDILDRHLNAVGGRNRLGQIVNRVARGRVELIPKPNSPFPQLSGDAELISAPGRTRILFDFHGGAMSRGFDGNRAWLNPPLADRELPLGDVFKQLLAEGLMFNDMLVFDGFVLSADREDDIKLKGTRKINDREAYQIEIKRKNLSARVFIDAQTFAWVKTACSVSLVDSTRTSGSSISLTGQVGGGLSGSGGMSNSPFDANASRSSHTVEFTTSDYRDVNGVKLPFSYVEQLPNYTIKLTIGQYRENVEIKDAVFAGE